MNVKLCAVAVFLCSLLSLPGQANNPLRVFIRAGAKTHGPGQHDHPRFLADWKELLNQRGLKADGAMTFPSGEQLGNTDVLVVFAADGMKIVGEERARFETFLQRGGGLVVIHDGVVSADQHEWAKQVQGGAWIWERNAPEKRPTKWLESEVGLYFVDTEHPITRGISNFDWKDEIYYDMDLAPDAHVLATSFQSVSFSRRRSGRMKNLGRRFGALPRLCEFAWSRVPCFKHHTIELFAARDCVGCQALEPRRILQSGRAHFVEISRRRPDCAGKGRGKIERSS
jgi:type 1 glutamine amidotransferase